MVVFALGKPQKNFFFSGQPTKRGEVFPNRNWILLNNVQTLYNTLSLILLNKRDHIIIIYHRKALARSNLYHFPEGINSFALGSLRIHLLKLRQSQYSIATPPPRKKYQYQGRRLKIAGEKSQKKEWVKSKMIKIGLCCTPLATLLTKIEYFRIKYILYIYTMVGKLHRQNSKHRPITVHVFLPK